MILKIIDLKGGKLLDFIGPRSKQIHSVIVFNFFFFLVFVWLMLI